MKKKDALNAIRGVIHELEGVRRASLVSLGGDEVNLDLSPHALGAELALGWAALLLEGRIEDAGPRSNLGMLMSAIAKAAVEGIDGEEGDGDE